MLCLAIFVVFYAVIMSVIMLSVMAPYLTTILSNRFDVQSHLDLDLAIH